ncbi:hypothetical protein HELRODRAFT_159185 [Helobdella robusta]|uniref:Uncharacterized protein n=1 Tax=Helobdella robusta TaxID=6412 RepID=T1ENQ1_HELRO|nr:hypothetical protein HELRODRAFT_159185 [Helobdella robusta]ESO12617.1 hypothetical protein HELRODRAFT_159185 [Helobdella robusta]
MDGGSSLSSNEDQPVNPSSTTSAAKAQMMLEKNKFLKDLSENNFSRANGNRSTMPVRGRRAILPLSGFVKKTQENESNSIPDLEETEIDVEVMFQEKISNIPTCNKNNIDSISTKSNGSGKSNHQTKLINLMTSSDKDGKSIINLNNSITKPLMVNEGMIELDEVLSLPTEGNMRKGSIKSVGSNTKISSANMPSSLFSNLNNNEEYLPPSLVAPTLSSLSSHPSSYSLLPHQSLNDAKATSSVMTTTSSSLFAGKKDGLSSGSKFGMSLEQCYNSGVFQRRNQNGDDGDSINSRSFKLGKTLSIVSDGDQQTAAPLTPFSCQNVVSPFKVNPYATMSRSQIASRMARKLEDNVNPQNADTVSCNILSPLPNRRSDTSLYHNNDDASSLASFPSFKLQSINNYPSSPQPSCFKTSSGTPGLVVQPQLNMTDGVDRRMRTSSSGYMLNRSGSHSNYGGGSVSRPQSTNG